MINDIIKSSDSTLTMEQVDSSPNERRGQLNIVGVSRTLNYIIWRWACEFRVLIGRGG